MKIWALVGVVGCFAAACQGQLLNVGPDGDGGQRNDDGGGLARSDDGGLTTVASTSSGGASSSGGLASSGGGTSSGGSGGFPTDANGNAVDEATVVEVDGATVTGATFGDPTMFPTCIAGNGTIQAGYLFAAPVALPSTGTVQGLGLITQESAVVTMGLYASAPAGALGLVTQTASTSITVGSNVIATPPTALSGSTSYFVAVEFEETTNVCADGWGTQVQFGMQPYGTFPLTWIPTATTTESQLNFFVVVN